MDLIQLICGCPPVRVQAEMIGGNIPGAQNDNCTVLLTMEDGSLGTLIYVANGDPGFEKERIEVFGQGRSAVIENWHRARLWADGKARKLTPGSSPKGHAAEITAFVDAVTSGGSAPLPLAEAVATTLATFGIVDSLASGAAAILPTPKPCSG